MARRQSEDQDRAALPGGLDRLGIAGLAAASIVCEDYSAYDPRVLRITKKRAYQNTAATVIPIPTRPSIRCRVFCSSSIRWKSDATTTPTNTGLPKTIQLL